MIVQALWMTVLAGNVMGAPANRPYRVSASLREVANLKPFTKVFPLAKAHRTALSKNLFFTCPSTDSALYWVYGKNDYANVPSLVTADNVLQLGHIFFDASLRTIEQSKLLPDVEALTEAMLKQAIARHNALKETDLESPAMRNVAFFAVAARLLGQEAKVSSAIEPMVARELEMIRAHRGFQTTAIFPYDLDYSQFIPRGHYTKTAELKRYFAAMMWYGLVPFAAERISNGQSEPATVTIQQALLIAHDLANPTGPDLWKRVYEATALYAGKSNNLTPGEWSGAADRVFGKNADVSAYANAAKLRQFIGELTKLRPAPIVSKRTRGIVPGEVQFRFMGQRAIPDSRVLQELSDPRLRPFPSPLDVMATLGSQRAAQILDKSPSEYNPKQWAGYLPKRTELQTDFAKVSPAGWKRDLYWSWVDALRAVLTPAPAGYPSFMRNEAWTDRSLYAALASWAELRHDTILYGLQSVAEMGGGDEPEPPMVKGYVEPNLPVYRRVASFLRQMRDGLKDRDYLTEELTSQFETFLELLDFLISASEKELANRPLTKAEHKTIRYIESDLEGLHHSLEFYANNHRQLTADELDMGLIADVHTAMGQALEVAVGRADHLIAVVPIEGKLYLARGAVFTFYEFRHPISDRMTDEAWRKRLEAKKIPPRPSWTRSFHVPVALKGKDE